MGRMGRKARTGAALAALAALAGPLAPSAAASPAAEEPLKRGPPRRVDFTTCAAPRYPKADIAAEHMGEVVMLFLVDPDGTVRDSRIRKSSGYESLDEAARGAFVKCRFLPAKEPTGTAYWVGIVYNWTLE